MLSTTSLKKQIPSSDTVTVDNGWFLSGQGDKGITVNLDKYGRPDSHKHFFPNGLKHTIDYAHSKNVKFGIWLLRGINRRAVEENLPVEGTKYHMKDIVNMESICPWASLRDGVVFLRYESADKKAAK